MRLRQRRDESYKNYLDRTIVSNLIMDVKAAEPIENYKRTLEDNNIDTVEIEW